MPQMMPLNWLILMFFFMILFMFSLSFFFYIKSFNLKNNNYNKFIYLNKTNWLW